MTKVVYTSLDTLKELLNKDLSELFHHNVKYLENSLIFVYGHSSWADVNDINNILNGFKKENGIKSDIYVTGLVPECDGISLGTPYALNNALGDEAMSYKLYNNHNDLSCYGVSLGQQIDIHQNNMLSGYFEEYELPNDLDVRYFIKQSESDDMLLKQHKNLYQM